MPFGQANFLTGLTYRELSEHGVAVLPWLNGFKLDKRRIK